MSSPLEASVPTRDGDAPVATPASARILVADDEPGICRFIARALERSGYTVSCVGDGSEALAHIAANPVDLLITDLIMPEIEGIETIMRLRQSHPQLPIIAISGGNPRASGDILSMAQMLGARQTLSKPFERDALLAAVRDALLPRS